MTTPKKIRPRTPVLTPRMKAALQLLADDPAKANDGGMGRPGIGRPTRQRLVKHGFARWAGPTVDWRPIHGGTGTSLNAPSDPNYDQAIEITDLGRRALSGVKAAQRYGKHEQRIQRTLERAAAEPKDETSVQVGQNADTTPSWDEALRISAIKYPPTAAPNLNLAAALINRLQDHLLNTIDSSGETTLNLLNELRQALFGSRP